MSAEDIFEAARELFADRSYPQVTIRDIAARAGVSPALVMKHGGSKRDLFLRTGTIAGIRIPDVAFHDLGQALVADLLARARSGDVEHLARAVHLTVTGPDPDGVRERIRDGYVAPLAAVIGGPDATARAELVVAALVGIAVKVRLFALPATGADLAAYGEAVQRLLDGPR